MSFHASVWLHAARALLRSYGLASGHVGPKSFPGAAPRRLRFGHSSTNNRNGGQYGYTIKDNSISCFGFLIQLILFWAVLLCSCIYFLYYHSLIITALNISNLPVNTLLFCTYPAISIHTHNQCPLFQYCFYHSSVLILSLYLLLLLLSITFDTIFVYITFNT